MYVYIYIYIYLFIFIYLYILKYRPKLGCPEKGFLSFFLFYISMYIYKIRTSHYRATCSPCPNLLSSPNIVESRDPRSHTFSSVSIHRFRSTNCCSFDRSSTLIHLAGYSSFCRKTKIIRLNVNEVKDDLAESWKRSRHSQTKNGNFFVLGVRASLTSMHSVDVP